MKAAILQMLDCDRRAVSAAVRGIRLAWAAVVLLATISSGAVLAGSPPKDLPLDANYRHAQREYHRRNFEAALPLLQSYLQESKTKPHKRERLFWVIDQIGRILLRERHDPNGAIAFFTPLAKDNRLSDAELSILEGWVAAAKEWKEHGTLPTDNATANALFERGRKYYGAGVNVTQFPGDDSGDAYFHIAASYLVPFIVNFDGDPRVGEALFMMGTVRRHSWTDAGYWSDNFYLREAIRRFPHTPLARKAFATLEQDVRFGYTGSSGDHTPASMNKMLEQFRVLAAPRKRERR